MNSDAFLKTIRESFDPCFRYLVLGRQWSGEETGAFPLVLGLIDTEGSAVVEQSFHRDPDSDTVALVLKLAPDAPSSVVSALVSGRLPEDIVFYLYEPHDRACEAAPAPQTREKDDHRS
jgi:hypothetical protein